MVSLHGCDGFIWIVTFQPCTAKSGLSDPTQELMLGIPTRTCSLHCSLCGGEAPAILVVHDTTHSMSTCIPMSSDLLVPGAGSVARGADPADAPEAKGWTSTALRRSQVGSSCKSWLHRILTMRVWYSSVLDQFHSVWPGHILPGGGLCKHACIVQLLVASLPSCPLSGLLKQAPEQQHQHSSMRKNCTWQLQCQVSRA